VNPAVGTKHLDSTRNPGGLKFGIYVFVHVYTLHMCIRILGGGMRFGRSALLF